MASKQLKRSPPAATARDYANNAIQWAATAGIGSPDEQAAFGRDLRRKVEWFRMMIATTTPQAQARQEVQAVADAAAMFLQAVDESSEATKREIMTGLADATGAPMAELDDLTLGTRSIGWIAGRLADPTFEMAKEPGAEPLRRITPDRGFPERASTMQAHINRLAASIALLWPKPRAKPGQQPPPFTIGAPESCDGSRAKRYCKPGALWLASILQAVIPDITPEQIFQATRHASKERNRLVKI